MVGDISRLDNESAAMPWINVTERVNVVCRPGLHLAYPPGRHFVPGFHADQIELRAAGEREPAKPDDPPEPGDDAATPAAAPPRESPEG